MLNSISRDKIGPHEEKMLSVYDFYLNTLDRNSSGWNPRSHVKKGGNEYTIHIEAPGLSRSDVNVELHGSAVRISATRKSDWLEDDKSETFMKSWSLSNDCNSDGISASYDAGIITVRIPTKEGRTRKISVD